jgi:hypothetical protein
MTRDIYMTLMPGIELAMTLDHNAISVYPYPLPEQ